MIQKISYCSVYKFNDLKPDFDTIVISVLDYYTQVPRPDFHGYRSVLKLSFKDRCEEEYGLTHYWPNEVDEHLCEFYLGSRREKVFTLSMAQQIVNYFDASHNLTEAAPTGLIVHCRAGVSRSSTIAYYLGKTYGIPVENLGTRKPRVNPRILRMFDKTHRRL